MFSNKVVVVVFGGNVQDCYATSMIEVEVLDFDNAKDEGSAAYAAMEKRLESIEKTMQHVY